MVLDSGEQTNKPNRTEHGGLICMTRRSRMWQWSCDFLATAARLPLLKRTLWPHGHKTVICATKLQLPMLHFF